MLIAPIGELAAILSVTLNKLKMKYVYILIVLFCIAFKSYGQRNNIPQVAFLINSEVIQIDSATFRNFLVLDTLKESKSGISYSSNYSNIFYKSSLSALIFYLNPVLKKGYIIPPPITVPSYSLCTEFIRKNTKQNIISEEEISSFDIILYPSLRDSLNKYFSQITECPYYSEKQISAIRTMKVTINAMLEQNRPISKKGLEYLLDIVQKMGIECKSKNTQNDFTTLNKLLIYQKSVFNIFRNSINDDILNNEILNK